MLEILGRGSSSDRQLRIYNANRDIVEVAREIANATEALPASDLGRGVVPGGRSKREDRVGRWTMVIGALATRGGRGSGITPNAHRWDVQEEPPNLFVDQVQSSARTASLSMSVDRRGGGASPRELGEHHGGRRRPRGLGRHPFLDESAGALRGRSSACARRTTWRSWSQAAPFRGARPARLAEPQA